MQVAHTSPQAAWKQIYQDALFELDPKGFLEKLEVAQKAIDERLHEVSRNAGDRRELAELEHAKGVILYLEENKQQV
jgi:hypothetical protein